jgi:hypothetical protein
LKPVFPTVTAKRNKVLKSPILASTDQPVLPNSHPNNCSAMLGLNYG